jgi:hypothetical protein
VFDHARPRLFITHGLGADRRGDVRRAGENKALKSSLSGCAFK